jgi:hypothetical protein
VSLLIPTVESTEIPPEVSGLRRTCSRCHETLPSYYVNSNGVCAECNLRPLAAESDRREAWRKNRAGHRGRYQARMGRV